MPRPRGPAVDRYLFSNTPPILSPSLYPLLPSHYSTILSYRAKFDAVLSEAYPVIPSERLRTSPILFPSLLEKLSEILSSAINLRNAPFPSEFLHAVAESRFMDSLAHALILTTRYRQLAVPPWHQGRADFFSYFLLRAINTLVVAADYLAQQLSELDVIPSLFLCMHSGVSIDLSLSILEELILVDQGPNLDLSKIPNLFDVLTSLSPFYLGTFCRILSSMMDELPWCGGDHCAGQCAFFLDWRYGDDSRSQLRSRRSYLDDASKRLRDRNHAVLLSIPELFPRLVKLISMPPVHRSELSLVDYAVHSGVFSHSIDITVTSLDPVETIARTARVVESNHTIESANLSETSNEEDIPQRIFNMMSRRFSGLDSDDAEYSGCDSWKLFDVRVSEVEAAHRQRLASTSPSTMEPSRVVAPALSRPIHAHRAGPSSRELVDGDAISTTATASDAGDEAVADVSTLSTGTNGLSIGSVPSGLPSTIPTAGSTNGADMVLSGSASSVSIVSDTPHLDVLGVDGTLVSINQLLMASHQVDILFVLYSLLIGKRRSDVQAQLLKAGIFPVLNRFFDALDWSVSESESRTEDSLKVHAIRLLHCMCDSLDDNCLEYRKRILFNEHERQMLQAMEEGRYVKFDGGPKSSLVSSSLAILSGLQRLSINSSPKSGDQFTNCMRGEKESSRRQGHYSSLPPSGPSSYGVESSHLMSPCAFSSSNHRGKDSASSDTEAATSCKRGSKSGSNLPVKQEKGLICKIAHILMNTVEQDDFSNTRRYLLSGCMETFQRSATLVEKTFIARQGLLIHLVQQLSESDVKLSEISQFRLTNFDLLGQLIKWNRTLFNDLNEIFRRDRKLLSRLLTAVSDRLVDSNVFVRSLALSLERFRAEDRAKACLGNYEGVHSLYNFDDCVLWEFIETYRVRIIHDLLSSVRVKDLTFENICCVNTSLILFVISCDGEVALDDMLRKLTNLTMDYIRSKVQLRHSFFVLKPIDVMENFVKLVDFWLSYFRHQGVDMSSLELNTNIPFDRFVHMANLLRDRLPEIDSVIKRKAKGYIVKDSVEVPLSSKM